MTDGTATTARAAQALGEQNARDALADEIKEDVEGCRRLARKNYFAAYTLFVLALASTVVAIFVSASATWWWLRALVTAIPGAVVLINGTLKFQPKSRWYWNRIRKFEALLRKLRYENVDVAVVSQEFSAISQKLEDDWPSFDPLPTQPAGRSPSATGVKTGG